MSETNLIVNVWPSSQDQERGFLQIEDDSVQITLESGGIISSRKPTNVLYSFRDSPHSFLGRIIFNPIIVEKRPYTPDIGQQMEDIFPPSTGGFYGRLRAGKKEALYIIQMIENDPRLWLTIGDPQTGRVYETQIVQPYEAEALRLLDDQNLQNLWYAEVWSGKEEVLRKEILSVLDQPSPSWEEVSTLVTDLAIPNLKLGRTARETLSQFVPDSFPESIQEQLMAFLAYVVMDKINMADIVDPSFFLDAMPMFASLIRGHARCVIDNQKWPPYLKLIILDSRKMLEQPKATVAEVMSETWRILWQKMIEQFPNWFGSAIQSAQELNNSRTIHTRLPFSKSQAIRSSKLWKKRLAAIVYGLRLRGHVNHQAIGLSELVYLGAAYRWPHRHMRFITRLGKVGENPAHLQVMTMPPSGVERVMRALPQCIKVSISARAVNLNLYDESSGEWKIPIEKILSSISQRGSVKKFSKRYASFAKSETYQISPDETKVLGLVSSGVYLEAFETPGYFKYWGMKRKQVISIISRLQEKKVIQTTYEANDANLISLASIVQGNNENVISLAESFLTNTPSSIIMLNEECDKGFILSRLPENGLHELASELNRQGVYQDVVIRCMRPRAYRSFNFSLYSRLLGNDGTWDDDVSAFLSQARSKRRELSESNP